MIILILATDMSRHAEILEAFKAKIENFDFQSEDHITSLKMKYMLWRFFCSTLISKATWSHENKLTLNLISQVVKRLTFKESTPSTTSTQLNTMCTVYKNTTRLLISKIIAVVKLTIINLQPYTFLHLLILLQQGGRVENNIVLAPVFVLWMSQIKSYSHERQRNLKRSAGLHRNQTKTNISGDRYRYRYIGICFVLAKTISVLVCLLAKTSVLGFNQYRS